MIIPRVFRIALIDASPPKLRCSSLIRGSDSTVGIYSPSITTFILFMRPWTTSKMCASVIWVSSWVSRSNLRIMFSISLSPNSFFAKNSVTSSDAYCSTPPTRPPQAPQKAWAHTPGPPISSATKSLDHAPLDHRFYSSFFPIVLYPIRLAD